MLRVHITSARKEDCLKVWRGDKVHVVLTQSNKYSQSGIMKGSVWPCAITWMMAVNFEPLRRASKLCKLGISHGYGGGSWIKLNPWSTRRRTGSRAKAEEILLLISTRSHQIILCEKHEIIVSETPGIPRHTYIWHGMLVTCDRSSI